MEDQLYDIGTVCRMLGTTSRTLRFYEEKHIITSTKTREATRRQYTSEQIGVIRNVLALRTLGIPVKDIAALQRDSSGLMNAILNRRQQMYELIDKKSREINLLNQAIAVIEAGGDVYCEDLTADFSSKSDTIASVAQKCAEAVVSGNSELLYSHFSLELADKLPLEEYEKTRTKCLKPIGEFVGFEKDITNSNYPNIIYKQLRFQKLGLRIKLVFYNSLIHGLWFEYYQ